jgi:DNA mismatch endonuclease (patch repair protein)
MADNVPPEKRSAVMAAVRSRGNRNTELALARALRAAGITGWRRHVDLPGRPDFAFRSARLLIFVDGCFWHGCARHCRVPARNREYWLRKITRNRDRDRATRRTLRARGWRVLRIWEHELKQIDACVARIRKLLDREVAARLEKSPR